LTLVGEAATLRRVTVLLDETLSLVLPSGELVPLVERGAALPIRKLETLSTARDQQPSISATLEGASGRSRVEVEVTRAPRGVAMASLLVTIDENGEARVELRARGSFAYATLGLATRTRRTGPFR